MKLRKFTWIIAYGFGCAALAAGIALFHGFGTIKGLNALYSALSGTAIVSIVGFVSLLLASWLLPERIRRPADIAKYFPGLPLVAALPHCHEKWPDLYLLDVDSPARGVFERWAQALPPLTVLMGAKVGSGASFVAANLALQSARVRRTILVDLSLVSSMLHRSFALPGEPGLSDILEAEASLDKCLTNPVEGCLWFLPAGIAKANYDLLQPARINSLLKELSHRFESVIVYLPSAAAHQRIGLEADYTLVVPADADVELVQKWVMERRPAGLVLNQLEKAGK